MCCIACQPSFLYGIGLAIKKTSFAIQTVEMLINFTKKGCWFSCISYDKNKCVPVANYAYFYIAFLASNGKKKSVIRSIFCV